LVPKITIQRGAFHTISCKEKYQIWPLNRFFVEDDRMSNREPESIIQKQKQDRIEIEEFYTNVI